MLVPGPGRNQGSSRPRPDIPFKWCAIGVFAKVVVLHGLLVDEIVVVNFCAWVNDGNKMDALLVQLLVHMLWMRKCFRVPRKVAIAVHIVNVEPDSIRGMVTLSQFMSDLENLRLRSVPPTTLVITQRPKTSGSGICPVSSLYRASRRLASNEIVDSETITFDS